MPSRGKSLGHQPDAARALRNRDGSGRKQNLFEGLDGADIGLLAFPRARQRQEGLAQIDVGSGGNFLRRNQFVQPLP